MIKLNVNGPVKLAAQSAGKPRRLTIVAYTGDVMQVSGYGNLLIDLAGLELPRSLPLLADHANAVASLVGTGQPATDGKTLTVSGILSSNPAGLEVLTLLEGGHVLQASVGCDPIETRRVEKGEEIKVNGRTITADEKGFTLVETAHLREVSITPLGADNLTSVMISLKANGASEMTTTKTFDDYVKSLNLDPAKLTPAESAVLQKAFDAANAEEDDEPADDPKSPLEKPASASAIISILAGTPRKLQLQAANQHWSATRCRKEALSYLRASRSNAGNGTYSGSHSADTSGTRHLEAALLVKAGYGTLAEKHYGARALEESKAMQRAPLSEILAQAVRLQGGNPGQDFDQMIRASGPSTASISNLLSNVANKVLELTWQEAPQSWRSFAQVKNAVNFKTHTSLRPTFSGNLKQTGPGGEVAHGSIGEFFVPWNVFQFAKQYEIDRMQIINDDLSGLMEVIPSFARAAARTLNDLVYAIVLANAGPFFSAGNTNTQTGGTSALSAVSLTTAIRQLRMQTTPEGGYLDLTPAVLVVPPSLEQTARELLHSTFVLRDQTTDRQGTYNPFNGIATLEVEPRLQAGVTNPVGGAVVAGSATGWYLFAAQSNLPMLVGFLNGNQAPQIQTFDIGQNINGLAMVTRCVHDFGAALGDYRAAQRSVGA